MRLSLVSLLAALVASVAFLFTAGPAAAAPYACTNSGADQAPMQALIDAGGLVTFTGTCLGNYDASLVNVTIKGAGVGATFDGGAAGAVLTVHNGITVNLQSMTLRNGSASDGAGIHAYDCGTVLKLVAVTVQGNTATGSQGGGILDECAAVTLTNSTVSGNQSNFSGGGIEVSSGGALTLTGTTVADNKTRWFGGGIHVNQGQLSATASSVFRNAVTQTPGSTAGGGIDAVFADVTLNNTKVSWNTVSQEGGGIAYEGGSPRCITTGCTSAPPRLADFATILPIGSGLVLVDSSVDHNTAGIPTDGGDGGGVYVTSGSGDSTVTITNSSVSYNHTIGDDPDGGGIFNHGTDGRTSSIVATDLLLAGNLALSGDGGGLYQSSSEASGSVSTFSMSNSNAGRQKSFLNSNKANEGGGIYNDATDNTSTVSLGSGTQVVKNQATKTGGGILHEGDPNQLLIAPGAIVMLNSPNQIVYQAS